MDDLVDITSKMPENFDTDIASKKWQERKEVLEKLQTVLNRHPRLDPKGRYDDLIQTLITSVSKDSNVNVASLAAKCLTAVARGLRKDFRPHVRDAVSAIFAKFKEKKPVLRDALVECVDAVAAAASLETIVDDIVEASQKPNPDIKIQLDLFLYRTIKSLKPTEVPKKFLKDFTPVLIKHSSDSDPEVRNASCAAMGAIMKCVGANACGVLFGDVAADKIKMTKIEEACAKATQEAAEEEAACQAETMFDVPAAVPSSATAGSAAAPAGASRVVPQAAPAEIDPWDLTDPVDITSKMPENFDTDIASKKWQERKEALEKLHTLLNLNPRLDPKGHYDDLIQTLITAISKDSNINVASLAAKCLTAVARGLRKDFRPHVRAAVSAIFAKFKERKPVLRDALVECVDAMAAVASLETIVDDIVEASQKPNPDIKIQLDLFLYRTIKSLKPSEVPKKFLKDLTSVLIKHTGDSDPEVRNSACSALGAIMKCVGQKAASALFGELTADKTKMAKVEEFYNKAVADSGAEIESMVQSIYKPDQPKAAAVVEAPPQKLLTAPAAADVDDVAEEPLKAKKRDPAEEAEAKAKAPPPAKPVEEKAPEEPAALLKAQSDRSGRAKDEKAHKLMKWNFEMPTPEHTQQLHTQIGEVAKPALSGQMLSKDFKQHIKAIDYLQQLLVAEPAAIINNVDLLLRWATLRFFDTNPSVLMRLMEFICASFAYMDEQEERLTELEMTSFLPYLLLKCGDQKEVIRNNVRKIVKLMGGISVPGKIFPLLLDGLKTKNSRQKADCLIIIESFLECLGVNITPTPQTMKVLASCISDRDSSVRNAALNAIVTVYKKIGDRVFPLIGQLNEKERAMLDERIKRSGKMVAPDSENHSPTGRNITLNATSTPRARSSSAVRRSLNVSNVSAINPADETTLVGDQSTAHNTTYTRRPQPRNGSRSRQSMGTTSRFQLDPKFFNNDIDLGDNATAAIADTSRISVAGGGGGLNIDGDISDFNGIPPAIRPPARSTHFSKRSESVSSISSLESAEQIDRTVHNLSCLQLRVATEATAQLRHLLQDLPNKSYVENRCELILKTLITQFFQLRSQHFETLEHDTDSYEISEVLRCICNFLLAMIDSPALRQVSAETTRGFIDALICLMADKRIELLSGCKQIIRSLNMLALRICSMSSPTNVTVALLKLLAKYQTSDPQGAVIDVVRKCIYKNSDCFLDAKRSRDVDVPAIIEPLYAYYYKFHADQPSCTTESLKGNHRVLTILIQRLVLMERYKILNYLYPYPENSVLVHYIRRCARALSKTPQGAAGLADTTGALDTTANTTMTGSTVGMVVKSVPDEMVQLFRRINNAEIFDGCVEELYNFLDVNNEQNGNFEELLNTCPFGCLIQRAFVEIRQSRLRKEPLAAGECVLRVLPPEDREFVEEQQTLQAKLDSVMKSYEGTSPTASISDTTLSAAGASQVPLSSEA